MSDDFYRALERDRKEIKKSLHLIQSGFGVDIYAFAYSHDEDRNVPLHVPAKDGEPLQKSIHDTVRDCYIVNGIDWIYVGFVPINYQLVVEGIDDWSIEIPIPLKTLKRYLGSDEKRKLDQWTASFRDCYIGFLQFRKTY